MNPTAVVRPLPGAGLAARTGDLLLVCADSDTGVDELLGVVAEVAAAGADGSTLVRRVAALLATDFEGRYPDCAVSGPTADGRLAVLVHGSATADVAGADGAISLSGIDAITSVNRLINGPVTAVRLQLPDAGTADPRVHLDGGVVVAAGVLWSDDGIDLPAADVSRVDSAWLGQLPAWSPPSWPTDAGSGTGTGNDGGSGTRADPRRDGGAAGDTSADAETGTPAGETGTRVEPAAPAEFPLPPVYQLPPTNPPPLSPPWPDSEPSPPATDKPSSPATDKPSPPATDKPSPPATDRPSPPATEIPSPPDVERDVAHEPDRANAWPPASEPAAADVPSQAEASAHTVRPPDAPAVGALPGMLAPGMPPLPQRPPVPGPAPAPGWPAPAGDAPATPFVNEPPVDGPLMRQPDPGVPFVSVLLGNAEDAPDGPSAPGPDVRPRVLGAMCANQHFNDPNARFCALCGIAMSQDNPDRQEASRPPLGYLFVDDGSAYRLDVDYVVGREPQHDPEVLGGTVRPLRINDAEGIVSRRHARISLVGWDVQVVDLGSANGTFLQYPGDLQKVQLAANEPVVVRPGAEITVGRRWLRFESHRNP